MLHHWNDKEYYVDARIIGSYINGSKDAITLLQQSSARYYQRPGAYYLKYDTSATHLGGWGGKFTVGKGSKGRWKYSTGASWLSPGLELNDLGYMNTADQVNQENTVSYLINQPAWIFSTYDINLEQFNIWNFNGTYLGSGAHLAFNSQFKNQWSFSANLIYHSKAVDTKILRGGYDMSMPHSIMSFRKCEYRSIKKNYASFGYSYEHRGNNSAKNYQLTPGI